ncbi:hypothetical protein CB1_016594010 [Camelus ferus]|nr:hypothetical protein CB1_016594010 [Camelus ferus]
MGKRRVSERKRPGALPSRPAEEGATAGAASLSEPKALHTVLLRSPGRVRLFSSVFGAGVCLVMDGFWSPITQDKNFCVISLPHLTPEFVLIQNFVKAVPFSTCTLEQDLYIFHRAGLLKSGRMDVGDNIRGQRQDCSSSVFRSCPAPLPVPSVGQCGRNADSRSHYWRFSGEQRRGPRGAATAAISSCAQSLGGGGAGPESTSPQPPKQD